MPTAVRKRRREGLHHRSEHRMLELTDEEVTASRRGAVGGGAEFTYQEEMLPQISGS